ncbi:MAG: M28 family peptidase [Chitinophagaceae bacterium]
MHKKIAHLLAMLFGAWPFLLAQQPVADSFPEQRAREIITVLAGDSLRGRGNLTSDLLKAANFVMKDFAHSGLRPLPGGSFFHAFQPNGGPSENKKDRLEWNGRVVSPDDYLYFHNAPGIYQPRELSSFKVIQIDSVSADMLKRYQDVQEDLLLWTANPFKEEDWTRIRLPADTFAGARLLITGVDAPQTMRLVAEEAYYRSVSYNIAGILPGKTLPSECIVFSAHYDHMGIEKGRDSIMNGANDNASGTTALLMLARYFAMRDDNARTLVFCAFSGEEIGLRGSSAMTRVLSMDKIKAGINLEMLGYPQYGRKRVYITGQHYSSMPAFLKKALTAEGIKVVREPDEQKMLFARSDNFPFFRKGIPFHTIMASDDDEPCYHKPCDEVARMDLANLCVIVKAIAHAAKDLISGAETPGKLRLPRYLGRED